jgi:hypothetical protein
LYEPLFGIKQDQKRKIFKGEFVLKFFDILYNKPSRLSQKFAVGVTKLMPPDEIRRFDGISELEQWTSKNQ